MEDRIFHHFSSFQVLDHNALEKCRRYVRVPDSVRVNDDDRASSADPKARRFSALDPVRTEQQPFALKERRQVRIELSSTPVGRAEASRAHDDVTGIRLHHRIAIVG